MIRRTRSRSSGGAFSKSRAGVAKSLSSRVSREKELVSEDRLQREGRLRGRPRLRRARREESRNEEDHRRAAACTPQAEFDRGGRARRAPENRGARQFQSVEETGVRFGLRRGRSVGGHGGAQISESGHGDHGEAALGQGASEFQALVETAARAVHQQHRRALPYEGVFDRSARRVDDLAAGGDAGLFRDHVVPIAEIREQNQPCQHGGGKSQNHASFDLHRQRIARQRSGKPLSSSAADSIYRW